MLSWPFTEGDCNSKVADRVCLPECENLLFFSTIDDTEYYTNKILPSHVTVVLHLFGNVPLLLLVYLASFKHKTKILIDT